jgi:hypothetical protein
MIRLEGRAIVVVAFIVLFWFSAWGLLEEAAAWLERERGLERGQIYGGLFLLVALYACCSPAVLIRI